MGSGSAWTARVLGATMSSSSGSGDRSSTRRSTSELTAPSPRPVLRSAGISTSTTHADRIRALTGGRRIEPTSPSCRRSRRPEPGRPSTYQSGKPVPTNRASSDLLVLDRSPEPLDEDIVAPSTLAVHADPDPIAGQYPGEDFAGELATLIGIEDLRPAMAGQSLFHGLDTERRLHGDRQPPGENPAAEPVDDRGEVDEAARHRNVGDVHRPSALGRSDC